MRLGQRGPPLNDGGPALGTVPARASPSPRAPRTYATRRSWPRMAPGTNSSVWMFT